LLEPFGPFEFQGQPPARRHSVEVHLTQYD
jgi:hypothetical protein